MTPRPAAWISIPATIANPARLELLDLLAQGERSVEELAEAASLKVSNTSAQLRVLATAGLVRTRRDGVKVYYRLADEEFAAFTGRIQEFAASRIAEVDRAARGLPRRRGRARAGGPRRALPAAARRGDPGA